MDLQKKIYNFILEYWKLIKKYTPPPKQDNNAMWDAIVNEATELSKKHEDGSKEAFFFRKLIVDWLEYIGRK